MGLRRKPKGIQNHQDPCLGSLQTATRKRNQKSYRKESKFSHLHLPKVREGSQKIKFLCFKKMSPNGCPKATLLETFWLPESPKSRSGKNQQKLQKKCPKSLPPVFTKESKMDVPGRSKSSRLGSLATWRAPARILALRTNGYCLQTAPH